MTLVDQNFLFIVFDAGGDVKRFLILSRLHFADQLIDQFCIYFGKIVERDGWLAFENNGENPRLLIKKSQFATDDQPIMPDCDCYTCRHFTRAYLHYLFKEGLIAYFHLASIHNIYVMQEVCKRMRSLILDA